MEHASFISSWAIASCLAVMPMAMLFSPAKAQSVSPAITGDWEGALDLGAASLRIVFHITEENGALKSTLDSPDQGAAGIPVAATEFDGSILQLDVAAVMGSYEGELNEAGTMLTGTWRQSGQSLPLTLAKTETAAKINRPQEPERPFPYDEEEVSFANEHADIELAGTLTVPRGDGPFPAVVLITGSGPQSRDEELMGHKPFLVLSDHLTRAGIAVLRYDDRGFGDSTGDFGSATSVEFAGDARAAVAYLKTRPEIDPDKIGLLGHSEGGLIAPMVASETEDVAFIVMLAGPGLPGKDILLLQNIAISRVSGMQEPLIEKMREVNEKLYDTAIAHKDDDPTSHIRSAISEVKLDLSPAEANALGLVDEREDQLISQLSNPWLQYFLSYDPRPALEQLSIPVLSLIGEKDLQVPAMENTEAIRAALDAGGNPRYAAEILPGLNHLFQTAGTGAPAEYGKIEETMAPAALERISSWVKEITVY